MTATRLRPTRRPTDSRVSPSSSTSAAQARASSTGLRSSRAMFSISAASSASASSRSRTSAGIVSRPAICAARQRRSPATSSYVPPATGRTSTGCSTPRSRSEPASASSAASSKERRGCLGLGTMSSTGSVAQVVAGGGRRSAGDREDLRQAAAHAARGRAHVAAPARTTSLANSKYASAPAQCGSWWVTGRP